MINSKEKIDILKPQQKNRKMKSTGNENFRTESKIAKLSKQKLFYIGLSNRMRS